LAWDTANSGGSLVTNGGTITGNVSISKNLSVSGDLYVLGNTVSIQTSSLQVEDSLIYLANNNVLNDQVDIGFVGHYKDVVNAHAGFIRDATTKEFIVFEGYTPELENSNVVDLAHGTFSKANINADIFRGNLVGQTVVVDGATVNGLNVFAYSTASFAKANAADTLATSGYTQANAANTLATSGYAKANAAATSAQASFEQANLAGPAFTQANAGTNLATSGYAHANSAYDFANAQITFATSSYNKANASNVLATTAFAKANAVDNFALNAYSKANAVGTYSTSGYALANAANNLATAAFDAANIAGGGAIQFAYDRANSADELATSAYGKANTTAILLVDDTAHLVRVNAYAIASFNKANTALISSQAAFNAANTALAYETILVYNQGVNDSQNTTISALGSTSSDIRNFGQFAYDKANAVGSYAESGYARANTANTRAYNSVLKSGDTITGALRVEGQTTLVANTYTTHLLPAANDFPYGTGYDLGSPTRRWRKLYISGKTIDLGGAQISAEAGGVSLIGDTGASLTISDTGTMTVATQTGAIGDGSFSAVTANTLLANSQIASTNTTTGTLVVDGGVGISGDIYTGGNTSVTGTLYAGLITGGEF